VGKFEFEGMGELNHVKTDISILVKKYSEVMERLAVPTISNNFW
jgi:hypothetical protein